MKFGLIAAALLLLQTAALAGDEIEAKVAANYPEELVFEDEVDRFWDYRVIDLDGDPTSEEMVVVYYDWSHGRLCALRTSGVATVRVCADEFFPGNRASLEVMDLDSDGRPEFVATFLSLRDGSGYRWLFRWRDGWEAVTADGEPLKDPLFVDLDGDGDLDALGGLRWGDDRQPMYFWQDGKLEQGKSEILENVYIFRREGPSAIKKHELSIEEEQECRIRIAFDDRITGAHVSLNGTTIFAPHHFLPGVRALLSEPLTLSPPAVLEIEVRGKPRGEMHVIVETP